MAQSASSAHGSPAVPTWHPSGPHSGARTAQSASSAHGSPAMPPWQPLGPQITASVPQSFSSSHGSPLSPLWHAPPGPHSGVGSAQSASPEHGGSPLELLVAGSTGMVVDPLLVPSRLVGPVGPVVVVRPVSVSTGPVEPV